MKDNKGMGMAEVILTLAVLIIFVLIFRDKIVELMAWLMKNSF